MKRILHIVSSLSKNAGIISMIMNYFREVDKNRVLFDFAYFKEATDDHFYKKEIEQLGGRSYLIPKLSLTNKNKVYGDIERIFDEYSYEIVHCHEAILVNFIQGKLRELGVKRLIVHSHSASLSNTTLGLLRNRLMTLGMNKYCDDIVACSQTAGEYLFGKNDFQHRGEVIVNGVDISRYSFDEDLRETTRKELGVSSKTFLVGTVGRCEAIKNQAFILDLLANVSLRNRDIRFLLVGEGPIYDELRQKASEKGVKEKVIFAGSKNDVRPALCAMDIFLFPSRKEGFGVALVEAQLCKLSCIANTSIPKETAISDYVHYISTGEQEGWIKEIINEMESRMNRKERVYDSSYIDIKQCAKRLEEFYICG